MDIFTSITLNYLPKARILATSLKKLHPDWEFHLLVSDKLTDEDLNSLQTDKEQGLFDHIVNIEELGIENESTWIFKHSVVELCTAVKGVFLQKLVNEGHKKIVYIDPDIVVFNDLHQVEDWLDKHAILLTPHLVDYSDSVQSIMDNEIAGTMRHGTFNLGFLAINAALSDGRKFAEWWAKRMLGYCYADYERGLFTDQKWCDLVPSFFDDCFIIRDPGFNVASWNLDCRPISFSTDGTLLVKNKYPLRFYHFTGYDSGAGINVISQLTSSGENVTAKELWSWYNNQLKEHEQNLYGGRKCFYDFFDNGEIVTNEMRKVFRTAPDLQRIFSHPYEVAENSNNFLNWWANEYLPRNKPSVAERLMVSVREPKTQNREVSIEKAQAEVYSQLLLSEVNREDDYVPLSNESLNLTNLPVKAIAFYLPQYHPIPENDESWGKGFTEWTNVTRAVPQFYGHYQPRLPGELGFYDLRVKDIQYRQIELAKQYGIFGFAFYYYWFGGKKLLEFPINQFLKDKEKEFPFCLIWANENWTRRWDGLENDILVEQVHNAETDKRFITDILPYLRDQRYIRINNRPLIIIYRVDLFPDPIKTTELWREFCIKNNLGNPFIVAAQTFGFEDPRSIAFDGALQFPPHNKLHNPMFRTDNSYKVTNPNSDLKIFSYPKVVHYKERETQVPPYRLFKSAFPSWDNEPRKPGKATIYAESSPDLYERWLKSIIKWTVKNIPSDERFVFINAWNEWAEGAYLEPDRRYGYANLQATMNALKHFSKPGTS